FLAELSFQLFGYAAYFVPAVLVIVGWNLFWCRSLDAAGTKATGATLLFACIATFLSLIFGTLDLSGKPFRAGGYVGEFLAKEMSEYLARTGSVIVILARIFLALIISTPLSFRQLVGVLLGSVRSGALRAVDSIHAWREERRREQQRRDVIAKHTKRGAVPPPPIETKKPAPAIAAAAAAVADAVAGVGAELVKA